MQNTIWKCSLVTLFLMFSIIFEVTSMRVASFPNEDISSATFGVDNEEVYCTKESCEELRERIESLEEAFRERVASLEEAFQTMISTLLDEKNQRFTAVNSQMMGKYRASRSVLSPTLAPSDDLQEDKNQPIETASDSSQLKSHHHHQSSNSNSVRHLKHAVKCSLAHMLDIHVSGSSNANHSAGILNVTLHRHQAEKSVEIEWSPPMASCIEFITGLWVKVYESGTDPTFEPYLSVPKTCLKSKHHSSGREALSVLLSSSNSSNQNSTDDPECNFPMKALIDCRSYQVEVVPDYQSLKGKSIQAEIVIPPTMDTMTRLESLMSVSALLDSLVLNWEDNSGCASRLTSINLRLWPDGILPTKTSIDDADPEKAWKTVKIEPITYSIPRSCLKQAPRDGNLFSVTLASNNSTCRLVPWEPLDKCRKYILEMESQYSSSWTGPSSSQTIFTSSQDSLSYPIDPYMNHITYQNSEQYWSNCATGTIPCYYPHSHPYYFCWDYDSHVCSGGQQCIDPINRNKYIDEEYCDDYQRTNGRTTCLSGFKCGKQCIPTELLCDGKYDCVNGEDENINNCDYLNTCQHVTSTSGTFASMESVGGLSIKDSDSYTRPYLARKTTLLISVKPNQVIWVDFAKLNANTITKVKLYDGPYSTSPVLLSHESDKKPSSVRSTGPNLYIEYYSYQNQTRGVKAYYIAMEKMDQQEFVEGCGGYVNGDGVISSPNWDANIELDGLLEEPEYPDQCFWFIEARHQGETLVMRTQERRFFQSPVVVYDGWNTTGAVLYDTTSMERKETIYSSSSKMLVRFDRPAMSTRPSLLNKSWDTTTIFTPHCKQQLTESTGTVNSPNYPAPYPKSSDCYWTITTAPGSAIRLLFAFFQTQEKRDFVYVYDGPTVYHPLIMEKSGTVFTPFVVNSSSNQVLVRFTSDIGKPFNGFLAVYSVV